MNLTSEVDSLAFAGCVLPWVGDVLEYLTGGMTREEVLEDFPYLEMEDINACLAFAAHRERHLN